MAELTMLERRRIEAGVLIPLIRAMQESFGEEAVNAVVARTIRGIARAQGEEAHRETPVATTRDLATWMGSGILAEGSLVAEVVEETGTQFGFDIRECHFCTMYEELGAGDLGFILSCNRDFAFMEGLAPGLEFTRTRTRMEGAETCDFRYRARDGE
jgi:predicted ArsR family transcriptional regulator